MLACHHHPFPNPKETNRMHLCQKQLAAHRALSRKIEQGKTLHLHHEFLVKWNDMSPRFTIKITQM